jgi:Ca-activated chloride channel family protein
LQNVSILVHSSGYIFYSGNDGSFGILNSKSIDTLSFQLEGFQKQKLIISSGSTIEVKLKKNAGSRSAQGFKLSSLTLNLKREIQQQWMTGDETYASKVENQFINTTAYPKTGLTLDVDRASYSNVRRFLTMNAMVPEDAVRIEEMINYFNFNYREPAQDSIFDINATLTDCPWNKHNQLLFAQVTSKKLCLDSLPPTHLVFLIDISASMDKPERLPLLKSGFKSLVQNMRAIDSVSIIVYGGTVGIALETSGGDDKDKILRRIDSLQPGGSTPGESGIKLAYSVAKNHFIEKGNNRIILATDGDFNVGISSDEDLEEMIIKQQKAGIYLTCLGIGMGNYKDSKIQTLAQKGNGNFAYIDNYAEMEKVLLKEFAQTLYTVADDAYLEVEFDPDYVKEYRLIGFDNKVGAIKDKDAGIEGGEIGSAYSTLIAFEIVPTQQGILFARSKDICHCQPLNFSLKYKKPGEDSLMEYNEAPPLQFTSFSKLSACHKFASAVIMFGSLLSKSKYVKDVSWNEIMEIAQASADMENYSQKEFITLVQQAKNLYGKKRKKDKEQNK